MTLGYDQRLYVLAFDHRGSFEKQLLGVTGEATEEQVTQIRDAKMLIYDGLREAVAGGVPRGVAGALVDEQFGAEPARRARADGLVLAMPVEKSGQDEFDFEYGEEFGTHIEQFNPTFAKVLVRYNPDEDAEMNARQTARLKELSDWLKARDRKFLFELLVPATPAQLESVGGDTKRYDVELRADLMIRTIRAMQDAGVEVDVWKIEGLEKQADCERIAAQTRAGGRQGVGCVVLGRGADDTQVDRWLRAGAPVTGYLGFAIGRSIWFEPVKSWLAGTLGREATAKQIAANYVRFVDVYSRAAPPQPTNGSTSSQSAPQPSS